MPSTLVDTGVVIAVLNRGDRRHQEALDLVKAYRGEFLTTWPVIAEACALMSQQRQARVIEWLRVTDTRLVSLDDGLEFMQGYMEKYDSLPCDLADASLAYVAARTGVREIWTFDSDFEVYRLPDRSRFKVVP